MARRERLAVGIAVVAVTAVASIATAPDLPARLVTHWGARGQANGTLSKPLALAFGPALAIGLVLLFEALPLIDPLGENIAALESYYDLLASVVVGLIGYVHLLLLAVNLGYGIGVGQALSPALAVVYYVAGVVMTEVDRNWFLGIRTPWTLSDDAVWDHTQERGGQLFKVAGLLALGGVVFPEYLLYFAVGPAVLVSLYATAFSYFDYRRRHADG
ncbi:MAG: SdpI family protein [Haloarculaceae archaeon]